MNLYARNFLDWCWNLRFISGSNACRFRPPIFKDRDVGVKRVRLWNSPRLSYGHQDQAFQHVYYWCHGIAQLRLSSRVPHSQGYAPFAGKYWTTSHTPICDHVTCMCLASSCRNEKAMCSGRTKTSRSWRCNISISNRGRSELGNVFNGLLLLHPEQYQNAFRLKKLHVLLYSKYNLVTWGNVDFRHNSF
jgi:hypothetical protein